MLPEGGTGWVEGAARYVLQDQEWQLGVREKVRRDAAKGALRVACAPVRREDQHVGSVLRRDVEQRLALFGSQHDERPDDRHFSEERCADPRQIGLGVRLQAGRERVRQPHVGRVRQHACRRQDRSRRA